MSRIGKLPIAVPSGVTITVDPAEITIAGPKGTLKQRAMSGLTVKQDSSQLIVERANDSDEQRAKHGLMRTLLSNMVQGVTQGFSKKLEINGVGFRAQMQGQGIKFNLGFSHDVVFSLPQGVAVAIEQNNITVSGIDKQQVGQVAAEIRALKKPEPYKGKGIKYANERIVRKSGKSGKEK